MYRKLRLVNVVKVAFFNYEQQGQKDHQKGKRGLTQQRRERQRKRTYRVFQKRRPIAKILKVDIFHYFTFLITA